MKYIVHLNAFAHKSYDVEADSLEDAYKKVCKIADLNDCECSEWDSDFYEIENSNGEFFNDFQEKENE